MDEGVVKLIDSGVAAWNRVHSEDIQAQRGWMRATGETGWPFTPRRPDLNGVCLSGRDLRGIDLRMVDLIDADLSQCDLTMALLRGANLRRSKLQHAILHGAAIAPDARNEWDPEKSAELSGADLSGADLRDLDFRTHDLTTMCLAGADMRGCQLPTSLANVRLVQVNLAGISLLGRSAPGMHLVGANLNGSDLRSADLTNADLTDALMEQSRMDGAIFRDAQFVNTRMNDATLIQANLTRATIRGSSLQNANCEHAVLHDVRIADSSLDGSNFQFVDFSGAELVRTAVCGCDLSNARLVDCIVTDSDLSGSKVFGIAVWNTQLHRTRQENLSISGGHDTAVTVDSLQLAQFIHILTTNADFRSLIDALTVKLVLILGRFTPERKPVLDTIRNEVRSSGYIPVLFDSPRPMSRDLTETIGILAGLARFVIADLTDARSVPHELMAFVPNLPSVPVQPLLLASEREYSMFEHLRRYPWVLETYHYENIDHLLATLARRAIAPAERRLTLKEKGTA